MVASTAHWIAAARARETERPDRLFADPFARELAGDVGFAMLERSEALAGGERVAIPVRVRWFDDAVERAAADGIDQVVLLGAGLDTRPYRLELPASLDWYEVDRPEIFAVKDPVLAGARPRCRRHTLAVDLTGDWVSALRDAGFDPARPTMWVAEGLVFYFTEDGAVRLLRTAGSLSASGSRVVLDTIGAAAKETAANVPLASGSLDPYVTDDPAALLGAAGWTCAQVTKAIEPGASYGRWAETPPAGFIPAGMALSLGVKP